MNARLLCEAVGWYGAVAIVASYFLNSFGYISGQSALYQVMNLTGALGIIVISARRRTYQPVVINILRAVVALLVLVGVGA